MHLVSFDIDGTLVASDDFDGELYAETLRDVLGVNIDTDWSRYENVTDSGILEEVLRKHAPADRRARTAREVHEAFVGRTGRYVAENPGLIREVPGALALVEALRKSPGVRVCLATGGWAETAELKLRAIGLEPNDLAMATGSDASRRTDIMRLAESRATQGVIARRRTYFGDGVWDQTAAAELGYDFVAVGNGVDHHVAFRTCRISRQSSRSWAYDSSTQQRKPARSLYDQDCDLWRKCMAKRTIRLYCCISVNRSRASSKRARIRLTSTSP